MGTLQQRLARGDSSAFEELYDACADRVGHYLAVRPRFVGGCRRRLAGDLLAFGSNPAEALQTSRNLIAFVFTVARNEADRLAARKSRRRQKQQPLIGEDLFCRAADGNDAAFRETAEIGGRRAGAVAARTCARRSNLKNLC